MKINKSLLLFGMSLLLFIFWAQAFPVTDPVESNYALTAKEMVMTSDWLSPHIYGKVWYDKPVLIYWLLALAMKTLGYSELAVRLAPALAGAGGVTLIYWFVAKIRGNRAGLIAATLLATALQYFIISKLIITDSVLFTLNAAALVFFYLGYATKNAAKRWYLLIYPCLGLAVLTKGPVGVILPGLIILTFLAWRQNWAELRQMRIGVGLLLFSGVALPWYWLMYLRHGQAFLQTFFGIHNYLRATVSEHPKDNVFYYYPLLFLVSTLPWTGVCLAGMGAGWRNRRKQNDLSLFLLIWAGVFAIFYSLMATKYPTYIFPLLFPIMVLTAFYLEDCLGHNDFKLGWLVGGGVLLWYAILIVVGLRYLTGLSLGAFVTLIVMVLLAVGWLWRGQERYRAPLLLTGVMFSYLLFAVMVVPVFANDRSGKQFARILTPYAGYQIGTYQFYSTAAVYYGGNLLTMLEPQDYIHNFREPSFGWFAKYTMPVATVPEFITQPGKPKMIIVPRSGLKQFRQDAGGFVLKIVFQNADYLFYRVSSANRSR